MKPINCISLLLAIALGLSGCVSAGPTIMPTQTGTPLPSPTLLSPTFTSTFTPAPTSTATLPATLEPEQAKETIRSLLQEPVDCEAPCFWGITPGQTTLEEAINIFTHLGFQVKSTTYQGKDFYGIEYDFDDGLSISVILTIQNEIVENLRIKMHPEKQKPGATREWLAYSPEILIQRYGSPSRVEFSLGRVDNPSHAMILYFESVKMIILYLGREEGFLNDKATLEVCPLINQFDYIEIWLGDDPQYPPLPEVPLEEATSLKMEEFSNLMTGDPRKACFNLKEEAFPQ